MKKLLLLTLLILLTVPQLALAQGFIQFYPPPGVSASIGTPGLSYASNILSIQNGGTAGTPIPQRIDLYNFCDGTACATGYEKLGIYWSGSVATILNSAAGTGTIRDLLVSVGAGNILRLNAAYIRPETDDGVGLGSAAYRWYSFYVARSIQGSKSKALTDAAAAVSFARIAVATNGNIGGVVRYTATSTDGTDTLTRYGEWSFAGADTAGTVTCGVGAAEVNTATAYRRANTLVCTMTAVTATTNCDLQITCTDNLAGAQTVVFNWRLDMPLTAAVTPQ